MCHVVSFVLMFHWKCLNIFLMFLHCFVFNYITLQHQSFCTFSLIKIKGYKDHPNHQPKQTPKPIFISHLLMAVLFLGKPKGKLHCFSLNKHKIDVFWKKPSGRGLWCSCAGCSVVRQQREGFTFEGHRSVGCDAPFLGLGNCWWCHDQVGDGVDLGGGWMGSW